MREFLKKLLGDKKANAIRARAPRVSIPLADKAVFIASNGQVFPLRNISETGLALVCKEDRFPDEASGKICLDGKEVAVELLVVRRDGENVAASFAENPAPVRSLLRRVFAEEIQAQSMTEVNKESQKDVNLGTPHWFYAPGNYELYYVENEGKIVRFELGWKTKFMVFADGAIRFGTVISGERENAPAMSELVEWQGTFEDEEKRKALRIIENIPGLEKNARMQMQAQLK